MTDRELPFVARLAEGAAEPLVIEERVVSESSGPARRIENHALDRSAVDAAHSFAFHRNRQETVSSTRSRRARGSNAEKTKVKT